MKRMVIAILAFILVAGVQPETKSQSWRDLRKTASKVKVKKKDNDKTTVSEQQKEKSSNEPSPAKTGKKTQASSKKSSLAALTYDKPVILGYNTLLSKLQLDPVTGELTLSKFLLKNLPGADYGANDDQHKITVDLLQNGKALKTFSFPWVNSGYPPVWTNVEGNDESYKIMDAGDYELVVKIDGKEVDKFAFNVVLVTNANGVGGLFINEPLRDLGVVGSKSFGEPDPNSSFIFKFYEAVLDPEGQYVDPSPISARLMKRKDGGDDEYLGGYLNQELNHKYKWTLTDNIFFEVPEQRYKYVTYGEITSRNGQYYVDLFYDGKRYNYNFEVKEGKIITGLSGRTEQGQFFVKRTLVEVPKYKDFRPTLPVAGKKENISIMVTSKDGSTTRNYSPPKPVSFTDGENIKANIYLADDIKDHFMYKPVEYITTLKENGKIIAQHIINRLFTGDNNFSMLTNNQMLATKQDYYTYVFMDALSKLKPGAHHLELIYELASGKDTELAGYRKLTFNSIAGNPKLTKWAKNTKEQLEMSLNELGKLCYLNSANVITTYLINNCNTIVWLRQDESKEYYLFSGQKMYVERSGFWEQWNFGTLKWNSIDEFAAPVKTEYKLTQNDIAILHQKQLPVEVTDKLKEIQDQVFPDMEAFYNKVKSLIGDQAFGEHKEILEGQARVEYVNICK